MLYHTQLFRHDPENGVYGDCQRTVFACLLNKKPEDIPNFGIYYSEEDSQKFLDAVDQYLESLGLFEMSFPVTGDLQIVLDAMKMWNPNQYYMLSGKSPRGTNHVVICKNNEIIHDTAIDGGGLVGPNSSGFYWISVLAKRL